MRIILEHRKVTEEIEAIESELQRLNRKRSRIMWSGCPVTLGAIDYTSDRVQSSPRNADLEADLIELAGITQRIRELEQERSELYLQRERLTSCVEGLGDSQKQILMMRMEGYTQRQIAASLGYSKVWIEKVCAKARKEYGFCIVSKPEIL